MSEIVTTVRRAAGRDARDLELLSHRVRQLMGQLPPSLYGESEDLPETPDEAGEIRGALQCVLSDHLEPAVRALRAVAGGGPC